VNEPLPVGMIRQEPFFLQKYVAHFKVNGDNKFWIFDAAW
jgi:hypothetical protein